MTVRASLGLKDPSVLDALVPLAVLIASALALFGLDARTKRLMRVILPVRSASGKRSTTKRFRRPSGIGHPVCWQTNRRFLGADAGSTHRTKSDSIPHQEPDMYPFESNQARLVIEDRIREANQQRLAREFQRREQPPTAVRKPRRHSRLWSLVHPHQAYS